MKYNFEKKDFLRGAGITGIIGLIALVLALFGLSTGVFDPIGQVIENYRISDGFFYTHSIKHRGTEELNPGIVLVDIHDCDSRAGIAEIVRTINEASPKLLAVDIIFGQAASFTTEEDSVLVSAFKSSKSLVLAQRFVAGTDGWRVERSFFADEIGALEGDVGLDLGLVRSFAPSINIGGNEYPTFIAQVAKQGGLKDTFKPQLINYSPVKTICLGQEDLPAEDFFKDQIVILGDKGDLRDYHDVPVLIDGQARTSGLNIIAQSLFTLAPHNGFMNCPDWMALIIGIILTYLFCTFIASPMFRIERFNGLWISIWQVIVLIVLMALTFFLFWAFHINVSLTYWLIGVGLSELATELYYFIFVKE